MSVRMNLHMFKIMRTPMKLGEATSATYANCRTPCINLTYSQLKIITPVQHLSLNPLTSIFNWCMILQLNYVRNLPLVRYKIPNTFEHVKLFFSEGKMMKAIWSKMCKVNNLLKGLNLSCLTILKMKTFNN